MSPARKSARGDGAEDAVDYLPAKRTLKAMRAAVQDCRGCDLDVVAAALK